MKSTIEKIYLRTKSLFPEDHGFMLEIAAVESAFGTHPRTFRLHYHGGVYQVDSIGFRETHLVDNHPGLKHWHEKIESNIGVVWRFVEWVDCRHHPIISFLSARLLLLTKPGAIPSTLEDRAKYWKTHYNTEDGMGTVEHYIESVETLIHKDSRQ